MCVGVQQWGVAPTAVFIPAIVAMGTATQRLSPVPQVSQSFCPSFIRAHVAACCPTRTEGDLGSTFVQIIPNKSQMEKRLKVTFDL